MINLRAVVLVLALPLLAVSLTGCFPQPRNEPVSIRRDGAALVVTFCSAIKPDGVELARDDGTVPLDWDTFWKFRPTQGFAKGDEISTDPTVTPVFPDEKVRSNPEMEPGDRILVSAFMDAPEGGVPIVGSIFEIRHDGLSETQWQHPDGSLTDEACQLG